MSKERLYKLVTEDGRSAVVSSTLGMLDFASALRAGGKKTTLQTATGGSFELRGEELRSIERVWSVECGV